MKNKKKNPDCSNCPARIWGVGIGIGIFCNNPENYGKNLGYGIIHNRPALPFSHEFVCDEYMGTVEWELEFKDIKDLPNLPLIPEAKEIMKKINENKSKNGNNY